MMFAAPEFIVAERVELLDEIEVTAELQHRMLANGVMRGEEGSEFEAGHGFSLRTLLFLRWPQTTGWGRPRQSRKALGRSMIVVRIWLTYRRPGVNIVIPGATCRRPEFFPYRNGPPWIAFSPIPAPDTLSCRPRWAVVNGVRRDDTFKRSHCTRTFNVLTTRKLWPPPLARA